ncbi:DUF427-domain-containing protein [Corynespora cassiicola Philippines]|uniref:DUF427-domain-containing protein n=1 Tax=Corynespora cassiicola Philippines TaxID=1448308 RepID=A0A2T2NK17_CORCC|nr:DUF427-domain-containing protein [Corynespora cassiicola Philippines]
MANNSELVKLAQKLATDGPLKAIEVKYHVRGVFNGKDIFDSNRAYHVYEIPYHPQFYIPVADFNPDATLAKKEPVPGTNDRAWLGELTSGNASTSSVVFFNTEQLKDLVKVDFSAIDQWFQDGEPIKDHPKNPERRIDVTPSTSTIRVELDGVKLAESSKSLFLDEKPYRTRYYLPRDSVNWDVLKKSDTVTHCPYKGDANYHHVVVNGKEHRDIVWAYDDPITKTAAIAGSLCFYNEKVDIWVDGVKEKK